MRLVLVGTVTGRIPETRLLTEMTVELSGKHQVVVLATDFDGPPKAGIIPCNNSHDAEKWIESLRPEILFTFHPELVVPSFDKINVCIVLENCRVQELEKYDLICTPYRNIKEDLENRGFYCVRVPLQTNTKAFTNLKSKRKYKLGMTSIDAIGLVNAVDDCLILSDGMEPFSVSEWTELLGKKITVLTEENDNTLVKFYNSIEICLVNRPDDYSTLHALACGCRTVTSEYSEIDSIGPEHIGKLPWLNLIEGIEKHIGERDEWQKYQIIQQ